MGERADYWTSFWLPVGRRPAAGCITEEAALELLARVPPPRPVAGIEWWIGRMHTTDVPLDFHHDRDNALYEQTGHIRHPRWSSVLYLGPCRGGALVVTDQRLQHRLDTYVLHPEEPSRMEHVQPHHNRLARFDGRLLHGVLDARNEVPSGRIDEPSGAVRLTVVMNGWGHRPRGLSRWPPATYPELATRG